MKVRRNLLKRRDLAEAPPRWKTRSQNEHVTHYEGKIGHARVGFYIDDDKRLVDLYSVRVPVAHRGRGEAKRALDEVLKLADRLHYHVLLIASPLDKRTRIGDLVRLYESRGFELTERRANAAGHRYMVRSSRDRRRARRM